MSMSPRVQSCLCRLRAVGSQTRALTSLRLSSSIHEMDVIIVPIFLNCCDHQMSSQVQRLGSCQAPGEDSRRVCCSSGIEGKKGPGSFGTMYKGLRARELEENSDLKQKRFQKERPTILWEGLLLRPRVALEKGCSTSVRGSQHSVWWQLCPSRGSACNLESPMFPCFLSRVVRQCVPSARIQKARPWTSPHLLGQPLGPVTITFCLDHCSHPLSGCPLSLLGLDSPFSTHSQLGSLRT